MLVLGIKPNVSLELDWLGPDGKLEHGTIKFRFDRSRIRAYIDAPKSLHVLRGEGFANDELDYKAVRNRY